MTTKYSLIIFFTTALSIVLILSFGLLNGDVDIFFVGVLVTPVFLFLIWWKRRVFDILVFIGVALLNLNLVGLDPIDVFVPILLISGLLMGHLRITNLKFPFALRVYFFLFIISYAVSNILNEPNWVLILHFISNILLLFFLKIYIVSFKQMRVVFFALLTGLVLFFILGMFVYLEFWEPGVSFIHYQRDPRFLALMGDPNILALHSVFLTVWLLEEIVRPKLWNGYIVAKIIFLCLIITQIILSLSRSGWMNLCAGIFCYIAIELTKKQSRKVAIITVVISAVLAGNILVGSFIGLERNIRDRVESFFFPTSVAEEERLSFYYTKEARTLVRDNPFGVGTGQTQGLFPSPEGLPVGAHNTYIQILSDNGWVSFIIFITILGYVALTIIRKKVINIDYQFGFSYQVLISCLIGLAVSGMLHDLIYWSPAWLLPSLASVMLWPSARKTKRVEYATSFTH
jgi:O-antigen ligase